MASEEAVAPDLPSIDWVELDDVATLQHFHSLHVVVWGKV